jgi:hypothetical protein
MLSNSFFHCCLYFGINVYLRMPCGLNACMGPRPEAQCSVRTVSLFFLCVLHRGVSDEGARGLVCCNAFS